MKKRLFTIIATILISTLLLAGCEKEIASQSISPSPTPTHKPITTPTHKPITTPTPTPMMTPTEQLSETFTIDLNDDGLDDIIKICEYPEEQITISVKSGDLYKESEILFGTFEEAYITQMENGDYCVIIRYTVCDYNLAFYSFIGFEPILTKEFGGDLININGSNLTIASYIDALGTWYCSREYNISNDLTLTPETDFSVISVYEPLITAIELPVQLLKNGKFKDSVLKTSEKVYPTNTDCKTYLMFTLEDGTKGIIHFSNIDYESYINGISEYECFKDVPYSG